MGLTPDQIQALLNKPQKTRGPSKAGGRSGSGKGIDVSKRDFQTWFKLAHKLFDNETGEQAVCSNPDCVDPRENKKGIVVAEVNGFLMCRHCFLDGWKLTLTTQETIQSLIDQES